MREALIAQLAAIRQMMRAADLDYEALIAHPIDAAWLQLHEHQRIVNSFLFNYLKIQDKIGAKLFRALLREWRELDDDATPMIDVLNRLEKLGVIDSVQRWDELRELRNTITHEYPDDDALRLANIQLALDGYRHMRDIMHRIEHRLQAGAPDAHPPPSDPVVTPNRP